MDFETEYKNLSMRISLTKAQTTDASLLLGDKFHRLPNQTMIELKKGNLIAYNLVITSTQNDETRTHYWSNILMPKLENQDELLEELSAYLNDEDILDEIVKNWELVGDEKGPAWSLAR